MKVLLIHGTCVEIQGNGILITGKSGTGKSSLGLQLIDRGANLVADDQTCVSLEKGKLIASPPSSLKGDLEVRGVGICSFPYKKKSPLKLCVELCNEKEIERLPVPAFVEYYHIQLPCLKLPRHDPLGAIKVELKVI